MSPLAVSEWWLWVTSVIKVLAFQSCSPGCSSLLPSWGKGAKGYEGHACCSHCCLPLSRVPAAGAFGHHPQPHSSSNPGRVSLWGQAAIAPPIPNLHETSLTLLSHPKAAPVVAFLMHFRCPMISIVFTVFISPLNGFEEDVKADNSP